MTEKPNQPEKAARLCPKCKRLVAAVDGIICCHGPGPKGEFFCPGSGDKALVHAARHLKA